MRRTVATLALAGVLAAAARADSLEVVSPLPLPGPHPVGCSNVAQDFARLRAGEDVQDYWEGRSRADGSPRYVTDLLAEPQDTLAVTFNAPLDLELYGRHSLKAIPHVVVVCYPTSAANARPDYPLPNGRRVPRMQRGAEPPILPDAAGRWPLVLFSSGYGGSPLSGDYIEALAAVASDGYVVAGVFHGDFRIASFDLGNPSGGLLALSDYVAVMAIRPNAQVLALDLVLAHPHWRDRIDAERIGGFGASMGGATLVLLGGAGLTTRFDFSTRVVLKEPRLKAAVGYIPFFGQAGLPAFGLGQAGIDGVALPYLAIGGTADVVAPLAQTEPAMRRLGGSRVLVALAGVQHEFDLAARDDIFTWTFTFLDAHVRGDPEARARLARMRAVAGGRDEDLRLDYTAPAPAQGDERSVVEYRNAALDHYFVTADPAEIAMLDAGVVVPGWKRTGFAFKGWAPGSAPGRATCRFFGTPGLGPNSHFYTLDAAECAKVKADPFWTYEGIAFHAFPPALGDCPPDRALVTRLYNDGKGGQANHRYVTSRSEASAMRAQGWVVEGPVLCTPP